MKNNRKTSSDIPLDSIILRRYENPETIDEKKLIKRLCLSLGLLQPGDSRDIIVSILNCFILNKNRALTLTEINDEVYKIRKQDNLSQIGISPSNILRQIRRLKDLRIVIKINGKYQLSETNFSEIFNNQIKRFIIEPIIERINDYCEKIDSLNNQPSMELFDK